MTQEIITLKRLTQQADEPVSTSQTFNNISIESIDNGGGPYSVIKTSRWTIESEEELNRLCAHIREAFTKEFPWPK